MFNRIVLFIFLSVGVYLYTQQDSELKTQEMTSEEIEHNTLKQHSSLEQKELYKAFEKILERKNEESRELASIDQDENNSELSDTRNDESDKELFETDYESEFVNMGLSEKEMTARNLEFEIKHDIKLMEQIENDQEEGLDTTEHSLDSVNLRIENNKAKLEFLKYKINEERE